MSDQVKTKTPNSSTKKGSRKRKKIDSDEEWVPSDEDANDGDCELDESGDDSLQSQDSDVNDDIDDDEIGPPKAKRSKISVKSSSNNSSNKENNNNDNEKKVESENEDSNNNDNNSDNDDNENESDGSDNSNGSNNEESDKKEAEKIAKLRKQYQHCVKQLNCLSSAAEYKKVLNFIKNLRDDDRDTPLSDRVKLQGRKDDLYQRCKDHILCIISGKAPQSSHNRGWSGMRFFWGGSNGINWDSWRLELIQFLDTLIDDKNKEKKRKESGLFNSKYNQSIKNLEKRLQTLEKQQLVDLVLSLIDNENEAAMNSNSNSNSNSNDVNQEGGTIMNQVLNLLPKANLDEMFDKHKKLISNINKAKPYSRYGSTRDHYSYKRCKSAIVSARTAIINDGNYLLKTKEWDVILTYLKHSIKHCDDFPTWINPSDNQDAVKVKDALKKMYAQALKGLKLDDKSKSKSKTKTKSKTNKNKAPVLTAQMKADLEEIKAYFESE